MKYLSEITGKQYDTVEDCEAAEKKYLEEKEAAKKAAEVKATARKERAAEVNKAFAELQEAHKRYKELRNKFVEDFGSYHQTYSTKDTFESWEDLVNSIFNLF